MGVPFKNGITQVGKGGQLVSNKATETGAAKILHDLVTHAKLAT